MPTIFSHSLAAGALASFFPNRKPPLRFWVLAAICAAVPDTDVLGFTLGLSRDVLSHRGFTHSLLFAAGLAFLIVLVFFSTEVKLSKQWWMLVVFFFAATASHGVLDAMTNGGSGVAFFAPFSARRYFFFWRPIEVSPLGIDRFLSARGVVVMISELKWIWLPSLLVIAGSVLLRWRLGSRPCK